MSTSRSLGQAGQAVAAAENGWRGAGRGAAEQVDLSDSESEDSEEVSGSGEVSTELIHACQKRGPSAAHSAPSAAGRADLDFVVLLAARE